LGSDNAFAGHFAMRYAKPAIELYRARFEAKGDVTDPYAMLAVTVVCGEDDEDARRMAAPLRLAIVRSRRGQRQPLASVEEALAYRFSPEEQAIADEFFHGAVIGSPETVRAGLLGLAADTGASELMLSGLLPDQHERIRSYERVANAMEL
jgi:alkanesulfonate monooxygenase SsuD/methylene tetrahydromethanopterin reductase-like flavin-dependent oxidoreductase (luciferase family)